MKRIHNLWHNVYTLQNLELAFYKAAKGKWAKKEVLSYSANLEVNLQKLAHQLKNNQVPKSTYTYFAIKDPKERVICAASFNQRVYHHAIMNIYHTSFEAYQIHHSYATRPEKGTHKALQQAYNNNKQGGFWLKLDVKKFFDTINHTVLKQQLLNRYKEPALLFHFYSILDSYKKTPNKGLPIGNLTSQYFANFYLAHLDRYAKQTLGIKRYLRYMDDILVWSTCKKQLWYYYKNLEKYVTTQLAQTFKPVVSNTTQFALPYVGFVITQKGLQPNKRNRKKYAKKIIEFNNSVLDKKVLAQRFWAMHTFHNFKINTHT